MAHSDAAEDLLHDVALELINMTMVAKREAVASGSDYDRGRHFALYEVVSLISQQATAFRIPLERIGLGTLDVDRELL